MRFGNLLAQFLFIAIAILAFGFKAVHAQNIDIGGIFGLVQGAIRADQERQAIERQQYYHQNELSPAAQATEDAGDRSRQFDRSAESNLAAHYLVDGIVLGTALNRSALPSDFRCRASEQFIPFQWCRRKKPIAGTIGSATTSYLFSEDGTVVYEDKFYDHAHFSDAEIATELRRLSDRFHQRARVIDMPSNSQGETGKIAVWGDIILKPLDQDTLDLLATGKPVASGLMVDFLDSARGSARQNLPVFRIAGGSGYYWTAHHDQQGVGDLRFGAANASAYDRPAGDSQETVAPGPVASVAAAPPPEPTRSADPPIDPQVRADLDAKLAAAKQKRAEQVVGAAKQLIDDASAFVKADRTNPKLLDWVEQISDLNSALDGSDADVTERKTLALSAALQKDDRFARFEAQRLQERKAANARYLGDAIRGAKNYRAFLVSNIAQNTSAPTTPDFIRLVKQIDAALMSPELERLQKTMGEVDISIRQAGLRNDFELAASASNSAASEAANRDQLSGSPDQSVTVTPQARLITTDKNRFLIEGDLKDVVLMYNTSPATPHVVKNLRGDVVFQNNRADICLFKKIASDDLPQIVKSALSDYKLVTTAFAPQGCPAEQLTSYDIIAARRGEFLQEDVAYSLTLIKALETNQFKQLATITEAQIKAAAASDAVLSTEIASDVERGSKDGFGIILLQTQSQALCLLPSEHLEAHRQLLLSNRAKLTTDMGAEPVVAPTNLDAAFLSIKRSQCGAVYGSAADLKQLSEGLKRDAVAYSFATLWIMGSDVDAAEQKLMSEKARADLQAAERQRQSEERARLQALRAKDEAADKVRQQEHLRQDNGAVATAASADVAGEVKQFTDDPVASRLKMASLYPEFVAWYQARLADRWELMTETPELWDYGVSEWKGRNVETAFSRVQLRMRNRMLGDYTDACFVFGRINDHEFNMTRDHIGVGCDDIEALNVWKNAHSFASKWNVD